MVLRPKPCWEFMRLFAAYRSPDSDYPETRVVPSPKKAPSPKKRWCPAARPRRLLAWCGGALALCVLPSAVFQLVLYRQNLAVARETLPLSRPIQKSDRLLIVSPHCDDETLGAGGTIAAARRAGANVQIVFLTNGDGSRSTQVVAEARELRRKLASSFSRIQSPESEVQNSKGNLFQRIAGMRQDEARKALQVLGVQSRDVIFLGYPDGGARAMWETHWSPRKPFRSPYTKTEHSPYPNSYTPGAAYCGAQVARDLEKIISEFSPTVVMTTHPEDTHPDHWAAYAYTRVALEKSRLSRNKGIRRMAERAQLLTFLVHHGFWPAPHGYQPEAALAPPASLKNSGTRWLQEPLSVRARESKNAALDRYDSQLVFTPHYLRAFVKKNELFGQVPAMPINSKLKIETSKLLLTDAPCDSSWRERWPAADILDVRLAPSSRGVLTLQLGLSQTPSSHLRYQIVIHALTEKESYVWRVEAQPQNGELQVIVSEVDGQRAKQSVKQSIKGRFISRGLEIEVPQDAITIRGLPSRPATLLISASTHISRARLDQTPTATLRLNAQ